MSVSGKWIKQLSANEVSKFQINTTRGHSTFVVPHVKEFGFCRVCVLY